MEFKSLADLVRYVENAFSQKFYSGTQTLRKGVLKTLAAVIGGALYMVELMAKHIWKNRFVSTCDVSALPSFGSEYGIPHKAAVYATGSVVASLEDGYSSAEIPEDTIFVDSIAKREYRAFSAVKLTPETLEIPVIAEVPGEDSNLDSGTELEFRDTVPEGLSSVVAVGNSGLNGGFSVEVEIDGETEVWGETAENYRKRLLSRVQNPPQGGSANDYKGWAESFPFVSDAYVFGGSPHANTVCVALANFNTEEVSITSSQVKEVSAYILSDNRRPVTADVKVFSVDPVVFGISARIAPFNDTVKASVTSALKSFLRHLVHNSAKTVYDCKAYVLSNSVAESFDVSGITKDGKDQTQFIVYFKAYTSTVGTGSFEALAEAGLLSATFENGES